MSCWIDDQGKAVGDVAQVKTLVFLVLLLLISCAHPSIGPAHDKASCLTACEALRYHDCVQGRPIDTHHTCRRNFDCPKDQACSAAGHCMVPCVKMCEIAVEHNEWPNVRCVSRITSCSQFDQCPRDPPDEPLTCGPTSCPFKAH